MDADFAIDYLLESFDLLEEHKQSAKRAIFATLQSYTPEGVRLTNLMEQELIREGINPTRQGVTQIINILQIIR